MVHVSDGAGDEAGMRATRASHRACEPPRGQALKGASDGAAACAIDGAGEGRRHGEAGVQAIV